MKGAAGILIHQGKDQMLGRVAALRRLGSRRTADLFTLVGVLSAKRRISIYSSAIRRRAHGRSRRKTMPKYTVAVENKDGWCDWIEPIQPGYRLACCDCGLVHNFEFRVRKGEVQFRARRNDRSTVAKRRHMPESKKKILITELKKRKGRKAK